MSSQSKPLKIFFFAIDGIGHLNACVGMAQALAQRGHTITFLLNEGFKGQFAKYGFEEILLKKDPPSNGEVAGSGADPAGSDPAKLQPPVNPIKEMAKILLTMGLLGPKTPLEKMREQLAGKNDFFKESFATLRPFNIQIEKAIEEGKPDAFIVDTFVVPPSIMKANLPWIFLCSAQPLCSLPSKGILPPFGAGK